jgi:hypothetical protein
VIGAQGGVVFLPCFIRAFLGNQGRPRRVEVPLLQLHNVLDAFDGGRERPAFGFRVEEGSSTVRKLVARCNDGLVSVVHCESEGRGSCSEGVVNRLRHFFYGLDGQRQEDRPRQAVAEREKAEKHLHSENPLKISTWP